METALKRLFGWMPLIFAVGFIAPLLAQLMLRWEIAPPLGLAPIAFALLLAIPWGCYCLWRGRWL